MWLVRVLQQNWTKRLQWVLGLRYLRYLDTVDLRCFAITSPSPVNLLRKFFTSSLRRVFARLKQNLRSVSISKGHGCVSSDGKTYALCCAVEREFRRKSRSRHKVLPVLHTTFQEHTLKDSNPLTSWTHESQGEQLVSFQIHFGFSLTGVLDTWSFFWDWN